MQGKMLDLPKVRRRGGARAYSGTGKLGTKPNALALKTAGSSHTARMPPPVSSAATCRRGREPSAKPCDSVAHAGRARRGRRAVPSRAAWNSLGDRGLSLSRRARVLAIRDATRVSARAGNGSGHSVCGRPGKAHGFLRNGVIGGGLSRFARWKDGSRPVLHPCPFPLRGAARDYAIMLGKRNPHARTSQDWLLRAPDCA